MKRLLSGILVSLLLVSCANRTVPAGITDSDLLTASRALRDMAQAVSVFQSALIEANSNEFVSDDVTRRIILVSVAVNKAGLDATEITRSLNALSPESRTNLLEILNPVVASLAEADSALLASIKDDGTKNNVRGILSVVRTSLSTAQLALALR